MAQMTLGQRMEKLRWAIDPLPGSIPQDNIRPIRIPGRLDGWVLIDCVCELHPPVSRQTWTQWFAQGHIRRQGVPSDPKTEVRGGEEFEHVFPDTVEPDVNPEVTIVGEDESIVIVDKPAPLPVHASGRFERNTLIAFLRHAYTNERLRVVHRLDANTSGLVALARTKDAARSMAAEFEKATVGKRYLARCLGRPSEQTFVCEMPISAERGKGGTRTVDPNNGKAARTRFRAIKSCSDGTTLVEAIPETGRTNQIRIHLWSLGMPVMGDPSYLPGERIEASQTLGVKDPPMCLHAAELTFTHPTSGRAVTWRSPVPRWATCDQDAFNFSASASSAAISSSNCFNSDASSA